MLGFACILMGFVIMVAGLAFGFPTAGISFFAGLAAFLLLIFLGLAFLAMNYMWGIFGKLMSFPFTMMNKTLSLDTSSLVGPILVVAIIAVILAILIITFMPKKRR